MIKKSKQPNFDKCLLKIVFYNYFFFVDGGYWVKLEILNIPWNESLLDFHSEYFDKTKILIETAVRK